MDAPPPSTLWPTLRWEYGAPGQHGVSAETLREMVAHLRRVFPPFAGLIVVRGGRIIFEAQNEQARTGLASHLVKGVFSSAARLAGAPPATFQDQLGPAWNLRGATRSVLSLLVGIALKKGLLDSLDDPAFDYLPETHAMKFSAEKRSITLRHLLTMTSGLRPIDAGLGPLGLLLQRNWLRACLRLPLQSPPGTRPQLNTANAHLLSAILGRVSSLSTGEFARRYLFDPLGITPGAWEADPQGVQSGSGNLFLSLEDMARIGYLVLNNGYWENESLIPGWYLRESLERHTGFGRGFSFGYLWYLRDEIRQDLPLRVVSASGGGGQRIFIVPALDLVAATVCHADFAADRSSLLNQAFTDFLLPAVS